MRLSDRFKSFRMQKHATTGNIADKVKDLEAKTSARFNAQARPASLDALSERTGTLVADALISPADAVESIEPTDTAFTGVAMGGEGWTFGGTIYNFVAVAAGVLQAGFNYLGKFIAGAGAVTLDANGQTFEVGTSGSNKIKWKQGAYNFTAAEIQVDVGASAPGSFTPNLYITAFRQSDSAQFTFLVDTSNGKATINSNSIDMDTVINGNGDTIVTFDAGLNAAQFKYGILVNSSSANSDTIIQGDTDANLFRVDASADSIGIGTSTPAAKLDVNGTFNVSGVSTQFGAFNHVRKGTSQNKQSDTTLATDSDLTVTLTASKTYAVRGRVWFDTPAAADFKYSIAFAGTTLYCKHTYYPAGSATGTTAIAATSPASATVLGTGTTAGLVEFDAIAVVDGSNRAFNFQWAQNTSTASNTTVRAGSYIEYMQMA